MKNIFVYYLSGQYNSITISTKTGKYIKLQNLIINSSKNYSVSWRKQQMLKRAQESSYKIIRIFLHSWCKRTETKQTLRMHIALICSKYWPAATASQSEHLSNPLLSSVLTRDQTVSPPLPRMSVGQPIIAYVSNFNSNSNKQHLLLTWPMWSHGQVVYYSGSMEAQ